MAIINRASLPEEFFDTTSDMLLVAPEPQYFHAQLAKIALNASLTPAGALGLQGRALPSQGASYGSVEDDRLVLSDPIMSAAVTVVPDLGKAPGMTIRMNRPVFANTTYTQASREVVSGASISTTPIDLSSEQVAITVKRFAGPYDATNSRPAPFAVDRFDASMSIHSLTSMVGKHMKRDFDKFLDGVVVALYDAASTSVYPTGFAADNDITVAGAAPLDLATLWSAEKTLDVANVPTFGNGRRVAVLTPAQLNDLKNDTQFARYAEFHPPVNPLLTQTYFKSVGSIDIYKSNTLNAATNGSSVSVQKGQMFGPGMVGMGLGEMPRVTFSSSDNYGEQALVIWLVYAGFVTLDSRFGISLRTG